MKTNSKSKLAINLSLLFALMALLSSCSEESTEVTETVDTEEIAEIVGGSLAEDTQGMVAQMEASAEDAEEGDFEQNEGGRAEDDALCGQEFSDDFTLTSLANMAVFYDYSFTFSYGFECNQFFVPSLLEFSMTQSGEVDAPRFRSSDTSSGSWMLSGLEISKTQYVFDGSYSRSGQHASKIGEQNAYDFDMNIGFEGVQMNKGNYVISEGTGTFSILGEGTSGPSFSAEGSIDFLGSSQVLITINEDSYLINLTTGEVTPV